MEESPVRAPQGDGEQISKTARSSVRDIELEGSVSEVQLLVVLPR